MDKFSARRAMRRYLREYGIYYISEVTVDALIKLFRGLGRE